MDISLERKKYLAKAAPTSQTKNLSPDQAKALELILTWYKDKNRKPFVTLGGYAGTGKTTLIAFLRQELLKIDKELKIGFASYTGKAARVLNNKLRELDVMQKKDKIGTIHSLIYSPLTNSNEEIIGWERKEKLPIDLIIIDEASMVDENIWRDLLGYKLPIIAVGDHGQLPPIKGKFNLMGKPEIKLEQIHRQAADNPIIEVSKFARDDGKIPFGNFGKGVQKLDKRDSDTHDIVNDLLMGVDSETLVLCGYNHTRVKLNQHIRHLREIYSATPVRGDRVICLRNSHKHRIFNGMLGTIEKIETEGDEWYLAEIALDDGGSFKGLISALQFGANQPMNFTADRKQTLKGELFDFGYAITVHKAQGSQARRVVLFEERFSQMDETSWRQWLYTAVTRAESELFIVG